MTPSEERDGVAARLGDVVFSYDRDDDLDVDERHADPDARGGPVLRGLDLDVPPGEVVVVMGASGGGKSTLLRTFNAIIPNFIRGAFRGDVEVLGMDATATRTSVMAERVGMVLQDYEAQLFGTSVESEVAFGPENLAVAPERIGPRIDRSLAFAGLDDLSRSREPASLSGGQKQRLVFASVLAMHPEFLVLDEPTSDLDPKGSREVLELVRELASEDPFARLDGSRGGDIGGRPTAPDDPRDADWTGPDTIVVVTHEIEEALLADRAVLLRDGRVYRHGPVGEVFTDVDALSAAHVAAPPIVEIFDRLGWDGSLPVTVEDAVARIEASELSWTPPGPDAVGSAPAGTGEDVGDVLFSLSDVVFEYETDRGPVRAVDGVDLDVCEGEMLAVVGHNGSGKTTLAKHLNGLLAADAGRVEWRGRDVSKFSMAEVGREIGYVFQNPDHQIFERTVRDEVAFGPENFEIEGEELERRVDDAIATVELDALTEADPFNLSKGQRQRVALASILATEPEVIVFDEPTTGLDADQQAAFMDLVARLNREEGLTVVMVTHDMHSVTRYAPRSVVMADGRKVADCPTRELFADGAALARWQLDPPQPVALSNELGDGPPALSVDEAVDCLGGPGAAERAAEPESGSDSA